MKLDKHIDTIFYLLLVVCYSIIFWDFVTFKKAFFFKDISSDTLNVFYPKLANLSHYIFTEGLPRWSFNTGMGENFYNAFNLNTAFIVLFGQKAIPYTLLLYSFILFVLTALICRSYFSLVGCSKLVSSLCALAYCLSANVIVGATWYVTLMQSFQFIFGLWCIEKFLINKNWYWLPIFIFLLGSPAKLYQFTILYAIYLIFRHFYFQFNSVKQYAFQIIDLIKYVLVGFVISLPLYVAKLVTMFNSPRLGGEASYKNKLLNEHSLWIDSQEFYQSFLGRLFSVDFLGVGSQYVGWYNYLEAPMISVGILGLILFLSSFFVLKSRRKVGAIAIVFTVILALHLIPFCRFSFWMFSGNYIRILGQMLAFFLIFVMGQVLQQLNEGTPINKFITTGIYFFLLFLLFIPFLNYESVSVFIRCLCVASLSIAIGLLLMYQFSIINYNRLLYALLALIVIEGVVSGKNSLNNRDAVPFAQLNKKVAYNDFTVDALAKIKQQDSTPFYRIEKNYSSSPAMHKGLNDAMVQHYFGTSVIISFNNLNYINFLAALGLIDPTKEVETRWLKGLIERPLLNFFVSIKYKLSDKGNTYIGPGYLLKDKIGNVEIYENQHFLPLGFCYDKVMAEKEFMQLNTVQKDIALLNSVVYNNETKLNYNYTNVKANTIPSVEAFDVATLSTQIASLKQNSLKISSFKQSKIIGSLTLDAPKILFFSIPFDKGWRLKVNGKTYLLQKMNIGFLGAELPAGQHQIELYFKYPLIEYCTYLAYLMFVLFLGFFAYKSTNKTN